jgi:hypothetical protein
LDSQFCHRIQIIIEIMRCVTIAKPSRNKVTWIACIFA